MATREPRIGERVFVLGTTGRYGVVTAVGSTTHGGPFYMVWLDGEDGSSGPFSDVAIAAPQRTGEA